MLNKVIVGISVAVVLLTACAEAGVGGVPSTVPEDGGPRDGALSVAIDAIQAALQGNYAGLSAEMRKSIDTARVETFMVVDEKTMVMGMRWGEGDSENPVWEVVWLNDEARLQDASFPVRLVSVSRDLTGMYQDADGTVIVFHEAQVTSDKQIEETQDVVNLTSRGGKWLLEKKSGKGTITVDMTEDQVKQLPWGDMWVKQVQGGGAEAGTQPQPTEETQPTDAAVLQPPEGWFRWNGPTLMKWNASKGSYEAFMVNGEAPKKSKAVIDADGSRLTLLKDQEYSVIPAAYKVIGATGEHDVDNETYEVGADAWLFKREKQVWVQLPPERSDEEYAQMAVDNAQRWLRGDLSVKAEVPYEDKGREIPYTIVPRVNPSPEDAVNEVHAVLLGGLRYEGKIRLVIGVEGNGRHVAMVTTIQEQNPYDRFDLRISQSQEVEQAVTQSYQILRLKPSLILRVVEQGSKQPVLVGVYQIPLRKEFSDACGEDEAGAGTAMIMNMV